MKTLLWIMALSGCLAGGLALGNESEAPPSSEEVAGSPVIPPGSLVEVPLEWEEPAPLKNAIAPLGAILWADENFEGGGLTDLANAVGGSPRRTVRAELSAKPLVLTLGEGNARDCDIVKRQRSRYKRSVKRLNFLFKEVVGGLDRVEKSCLRRSRCESRQLDANLNDLRAEVKAVGDFALAEQRAPVDRELQYRFRVVGEFGKSLLAAGFVPVGEAAVGKVRFHAGKWIPMPPGAPFIIEGFESAPVIVGPGEWAMARKLNATQACLKLLWFGLDFQTAWENGSTKEVRYETVRARAFDEAANPDFQN